METTIVTQCNFFQRKGGRKTDRWRKLVEIKRFIERDGLEKEIIENLFKKGGMDKEKGKVVEYYEKRINVKEEHVYKEIYKLRIKWKNNVYISPRKQGWRCCK